MGIGFSGFLFLEMACKLRAMKNSDKQLPIIMALAGIFTAVVLYHQADEEQEITPYIPDFNDRALYAIREDNEPKVAAPRLNKWETDKLRGQQRNLYRSHS